MHRLRRNIIRNLTILLVMLAASSLLTVLYLSSLYTTIPLNVPFISTMPVYRNKWQYTPPDRLRQPNPEGLTAAFVTIIKGDSISANHLRQSIRNIEDVFNNQHHYPYIIFTRDELSVKHKEVLDSLTQADVHFERVSALEYGHDSKMTSFKDRVLQKTADNDIKDTQFRSKFISGAVFQNSKIQEIDYLWMFEGGGEYTCPIAFDPFVYMQQHNKTLSFSLSSYQQPESISTLFQAALEFRLDHLEWMSDDTLFSAMVNDDVHNGCIHWNHFQIIKTSLFTDIKYQTYLNFIDELNSKYHYGWTNMAIQSIGYSLFARKDEVHVWEDIGYSYKYSYSHCPNNRQLWSKCYCRPDANYEHNPESCNLQFR